MTDNGGASSCASAPLTVDAPSNTPPVLSVDAPHGLSEGTGFTLTGGFVDPNADSWVLSINWGDGTTDELNPAQAGGFSAPHTYADNGTFTITVAIDDGTATDRLEVFGVDVANLPPAVTVQADTSNLDATLALGLTDPGADQLSVTVNWGDGTVESVPSASGAPASNAPTSERRTAAHAYAAGGDYEVQVCVSDGDGGRRCATQVLSVAEPQPISQVEPSGAPGTLGASGAPGAPGASDTPAPSGAGGFSTQLASTGENTAAIWLLGAILVTLGTLLLVAGRWRRLRPGRGR